MKSSENEVSSLYLDNHLDDSHVQDLSDLHKTTTTIVSEMHLVNAVFVTM